MDALIAAKELVKKYGDKTVLNGVNVKIDKGDVVAIIGPSGSGKSTLVRCLAGLEKYDGLVTLNGAPIMDAKTAKGKIGMVFQSFNLFPHYTVLKNVAYPYHTIKKINKTDSLRKAKTLLEKMHLEDTQNQYPSTLSGGQKQRVAIARALIMEPEIIIYDEPTSSLDPELAYEVFETIKNLADNGYTMIVVTHQISAVRHFANKIVFMEHGNICVEGSIENVLNNMNNPNLKKFLERVEFSDL
ncbi:amino acid ABC transporter ATP-binding protein [Muricomes intestini]|jgi:polar amino acid transport system ATP-binding protein|uniref:Polar amino acid transport system ATP-binding protein n=1 Tax=Muricomes intestini TaxID=1796634 RepID=A0A4V2URB3_9FIRM|nr:amino acid ABC transporter ATP-binding protein [Muricomes intestini]TCS76412.1 polar amino acid transport system ATP-binding protein [Muricomes intestini]